MKKFRILFLDPDGNTVMDRKCSRDYYIMYPDTPSQRPNHATIHDLLSRDARERGVRMKSYEVDEEKGITVQVEYL